MEPAGGPYHRLGVSDGMDDSGLTLEDNLARIAQAPLSYVPGTSWGYSVALDVIGAVLERVTHMDVRPVVADLVTTPLGIRDTGFSVVDRQRLVTHYADGTPEPTRIHDGEEVPHFDGRVTFAPSRVFDPNAFPSGGAYVHSWFIDPATSLTVVALTNTTFEGMSGTFTTDVRDAAYG